MDIIDGQTSQSYLAIVLADRLLSSNYTATTLTHKNHTHGHAGTCQLLVVNIIVAQLAQIPLPHTGIKICENSLELVPPNMNFNLILKSLPPTLTQAMAIMCDGWCLDGFHGEIPIHSAT